tara:strand:+ start:1435 stop:1551 length:117 start_codon:yes stop_codon:yes gene_type:complete
MIKKIIRVRTKMIKKIKRWWKKPLKYKAPKHGMSIFLR